MNRPGTETEDTTVDPRNPFDIIAAEANEESQDQNEGGGAGEGEVEAPAVQTKPIFKGLNKTFNTPEELASYALELEKKQIEYEAKMSILDKPRHKKDEDETVVEPVKVNLAEKLFTDTEGTLQALAQQIESNIDAKYAKKNSDKKFWDEFYADFEDLRGCEELVDWKLDANREKWKNVPLEQARKLLANETRSYIMKIRELNGGSGSTVLPSGDAAIPSSTKAPLPKVPVKQDAPKSFIDQVKAMNKRRKTG